MHKKCFKEICRQWYFWFHSEPKGLRDILKKYLSNKGWNIKKEWIVLTPSVGAPIYSIYNLIPKKTQVIIPTPIYINFLKAPKHLKRKVQKLPMVNDKGRLVIDFNKL